MPWRARRQDVGDESWEIYPQAGTDANGFAPFAVSTRTPMLALTEVGASCRALKIELQNLSANRVVLYVNKSGEGTVIDEDENAVGISAGKQRALLYAELSDLYIGIDAAGDPDAGNPSSAVKLRVLVRKRSG